MPPQFSCCSLALTSSSPVHSSCVVHLLLRTPDSAGYVPSKHVAGVADDRENTLRRQAQSASNRHLGSREYHERVCRRQHPGAKHVIGDSRDAIFRKFDANNRMRFPAGFVTAEVDDHRLPIRLSQAHLPLARSALVLSEVW